MNASDSGYIDNMEFLFQHGSSLDDKDEVWSVASLQCSQYTGGEINQGSRAI
jgi:hypothetical protein